MSTSAITAPTPLQQVVAEVAAGDETCYNLLKDVFVDGDSPYTYYHERDLPDLVQACRINAAQMGACLLAVLCLLTCQKGRRALAPRRHKRCDAQSSCASVARWAGEVFRGGGSTQVFLAVADHVHGDAAWSKRSGDGSGADAYDCQVGIDGQVMTRFCLLGFRFGLTGCAVSAALIPLYMHTPNGVESLAGFTRYTILNLGQRDRQETMLWAVVAAVYILTGVLLCLLRNEWRVYIQLRRAHLRRRAAGKLGIAAAQAAYSVMIERVPPAAQEDGKLKGCLLQSSDFSIKSCFLQPDTRDMHLLLAMSSVKGALFCCRRRRQNAYTHTGLDKGMVAVARLKWRAAKLFSKAIQDAAAGAAPGTTSTAFVTFAKASDRATIEQVLLFGEDDKDKSEHFDDWLVLPAPRRDEIIWENVSMSKTSVDRRRRLGALISVLGAIFWSTPIIGIWQASNLGEFASGWPWLHDFLMTHQLYEIVSGYLPVVLIVLVLFVVPYALEFLSSNFECTKTRTDVQRIVLRRNFMFQLATMYVIVLSGSIAKTLHVFLAKPSCLVSMLAILNPSVSAYFVILVIISTGTSLPFLLLFPLLQMLPACLLCGLQVTPLYCAFQSEAASLALVLILGVTYSIIAPLILPACTLYFGCAWMAYRWLFRNVYEPCLDFTGSFWHDLFDVSMFGLFAATVSFALFLGSYADNMQDPQALALWILPLVVAYFHYAWKHYYKRFCHFMPLDDALQLDKDRTHVGSRAVSDMFDKDYYKDDITKLLDGTNPSREAEMCRHLQSLQQMGATSEAAPSKPPVPEEAPRLPPDSLPPGLQESCQPALETGTSLRETMLDNIAFARALLDVPGYVLGLMGWSCAANLRTHDQLGGFSSAGLPEPSPRVPCCS